MSVAREAPRMNVRLSSRSSSRSAVSVFAQQTPQQLADAELPSLLTIYKDLHTHPELSGHEEKSSAFVAKELKAVGCEVTEKVGKYEKPNMTALRRRGGDEEWRRTNGPGAHRFGWTAGDGGNRAAVREQGHDNERRRQTSRRDARLRARHSHVHFHRHRAGHGETEGPMEGHDRLRRPAGGGDRDRCARVAERRALHPLAQAGLRAWPARQRAASPPAQSGSRKVTPTRMWIPWT